MRNTVWKQTTHRCLACGAAWEERWYMRNTVAKQTTHRCLVECPQEDWLHQLPPQQCTVHEMYNEQRTRSQRLHKQQRGPV